MDHQLTGLSQVSLLKGGYSWNYRDSVILVVVSVLFFVCFMVPVQWKLLAGDRALT
jgi:hypothetical protein